MMKILITWTEKIGKEPENKTLLRKSVATAKTAYNHLAKRSDVSNLQAYTLTPTTFEK